MSTNVYNLKNQQMKNIPYKKEIDPITGEILNPITKDNPYLNVGPNRKTRRFLDFGKTYIQRDLAGNEIGRIRKNGSNSKPNSVMPSLNAAIQYIRKNIIGKTAFKNFFSKKLQKQLKLVA